jgi:hypothetical protein
MTSTLPIAFAYWTIAAGLALMVAAYFSEVRR